MITIILDIMSIIKRSRVILLLSPFYRTLLRKNITEYHLIFKEGFSASTLHRMKHGKPITTKTLDSLCDILDCEISDVIEGAVA